MNRKTLIVLAAIAVAAALLAVVGQRSDPGGSGGGSLVGTRLLPELEATLNMADSVEIVAAGGVDAVTLERAGDRWSVSQQDGYPADFAKLREGLVALAEATVVEEKTSNPDFYDRLGVEPLELESAAGTGVRIRAGERELASVVLGAESGADGRFARVADAATSTLIDRDPEFPTDPTQWLAPALIDVRGDRVQRVEITHADGERLAIAKASRDETNFTVEDIPEGRELQYASIANVTGNALRELRLEGARTAPDGTEPDVTAVFSTFGGLVLTVTGAGAEPWIGLDARYDAAQAARFAGGNAGASPASADDEAADAAPSAADGATDAPAANASDASDASDTDGEIAAGDDGSAVAAEAAAIRDRVAGWQFRIPSHIYSQMTRRIEDLLEAPAEAVDE